MIFFKWRECERLHVATRRDEQGGKVVRSHRSGAGAGRPVFHSRIEDRINTFRRGLTSDLAWASARGLPTGLSRMFLILSVPPPA